MCKTDRCMSVTYTGDFRMVITTMVDIIITVIMFTQMSGNMSMEQSDARISVA